MSVYFARVRNVRSFSANPNIVQFNLFFGSNEFSFICVTLQRGMVSRRNIFHNKFVCVFAFALWVQFFFPLFPWSLAVFTIRSSLKRVSCESFTLNLYSR